jgi:nicotinamidase-related amidase
MPLDLAELASPAHTAILTMEIQRGVVGDRSSFPQLAEAADRVGVVPNTVRLVTLARSSGMPVIHCTAEFRPDRAGTAVNCQLIAAVLRNPSHMLTGSEAAEMVPELAPKGEDLVCTRLTGVSPFAGTSLDMWLRNLGVRTVVSVGVSVNLGLLGLAIEAVNLGYRVVVPRDAVAGIPEEYAETVLEHTFPLISTLTTTDDLVKLWSH